MDYALLGAFFVSYSTFALIELSLLFNRRYGALVTFAAVQAAMIMILQQTDYSPFCETGKSALVCSNAGRGIAALAGFWVHVLIGTASLFLLSIAISSLASTIKPR